MKKIMLIAILFGFGSLYAQTWKPNPKFMTDTAKKAKISVQCYGTTKKNERCKIHGQPDKTGRYYCRFHMNQS